MSCMCHVSMHVMHVGVCGKHRDGERDGCVAMGCVGIIGNRLDGHRGNVKDGSWWWHGHVAASIISSRSI